MSCCCDKILFFCKQKSCGEIDFDVKAQLEGVHKLVTTFIGVEITIEKSFLPDDKIIFPLDQLNENYTYTCQLFDPEGNKILIRKDDVDYDCFVFETVISYDVTIEE